ncbi:MAG: hypothetical protein ACE5E9_07285 [Nitrospinaceae bacterium]
MALPRINRPPLSLLHFLKARKREWALSIFSTAATLLFCLGLIEIYFWNKNSDAWVAPHTVFDAERGWSNAVNARTVHEGITYTTNSLGFRSAEINPAKEHILILGDSVAYGAGVNDDENVSYYLNQRMPGYQVLNLAVMGYGIGQYYLTLKKFIRQTRPRHVVVILYTVNDLADTRSDQMFGASKPLFVIDNGRLTPIRKTVSRFSCMNLISKSWTLRHFSPEKLRKRFCDSTAWDKSAAWALVFDLLEKIHDLALQHGARPLFVLSPSLMGVKWTACQLQGNPGSCRNVDQGYSGSYQSFLNRFRKSRFPYLDYNNVLLALSQKGDIGRLYNKGGKDIHHYSPPGNRVLADTIAGYLQAP